jgi:hypothetical protein
MTLDPGDYERLGALYLGRVLDPATRAPTGAPFLVDARELTTHAVIVGMTGSGKTGLGVALLEEAALDGVPAIVIDPKGDLANLALAFPELRAEDFRPWVDPDEARRKGVSEDQLAADTAERWKRGLAEWGQDGARIARLRAAADVVVYTPGARMGVPLALLRSFDAPPPALRDAPDLVRERAVSAAAGLLGLVGVDADPVKSRELLLVATLLERAWAEGKNLPLADVVRGVAEPPFDTIGLFDLESVFPAKARFELAMALNQLIASPGFSAWTEGEPLDVARLLRSPSGKPRLAVISIAHLPDAQRMFFVTALLAETVAWMRTQPGSSGLRALLYMDEIYGYFPPSAAPPSKAPMLTLLKQARAFGLGVVLATQNPVDLDYKGLGNAGTWMVGRLQTERDKARILDGLEGAAAVSGQRFERAELDRLVGSLEARQFIVRSVHQAAPVLVQSRWALTYLRGPMTREQLAALAPAAPAAAPPQGPLTIEATIAPPPPTTPGPAPATAAGARPVLPPEVTEFFAAPAHAGGPVAWRPTVLGSARVRFASAKAGLDEWRTIAMAAPLDEHAGAPLTAGAVAGLDWSRAEPLPASTTLDRQPPIGSENAPFAPLPAAAARPASYSAWRKAFEAHLAQTCAMTLFRCAALKALSNPGESEADFRARLAEAALAARAAEVEKLRKKYRPKVSAAEARVVRAQDRVVREESQASAQTVDTAVSVGSSILGAIFGRRATVSGHVGRARSAARSATRAAKERADVERAEEELRRAREAMDELEREVTDAVRRIDTAFDPSALVLEPVHIKPKKADIVVGVVALLWRP